MSSRVRAFVDDEQVADREPLDGHPVLGADAVRSGAQQRDVLRAELEQRESRLSEAMEDNDEEREIETQCPRSVPPSAIMRYQ